MRRRTPSDDMVEVVLVDPDGVVEPTGAPSTGAVGRDRDRGARGDAAEPSRGDRWLASPVLAVVVAVGLGAVGVAVGRGAVPAVADPVVLPGAVAALDRPLEAVWEVEAPVGATVAGDLVVVLAPFGADEVLRAVEAATGTTRWTAPRQGGDDGLAWCRDEAGPADAPVTVCWRVLDRDRGRVVAVDPGTGDVLHESAAPLPAAGYGVVDGDVVTGHEHDGSLVVRRLDPVSGRELWRRERVLTDGAGLFTTRVEVAHGLVLVHGPVPWVLDPADGALVGAWEETSLAADEVLLRSPARDLRAAPHGFGVWPEVVAGRRSPVGTWYSRDGRELVRLDGFLAEPELSDGSVPEVVLTSSRDGVRATDVATGEDLWHHRGAHGVLVRADGAVVLAEPDRLVAVDLVGGTPAWTAAVPGAEPAAGVVTDGVHVVVPAYAAGRWLLAAVGIRDGAVAWTAALPPAVATVVPAGGGEGGPWLHAVGDRVVVGGQGRVVGLGGTSSADGGRG